MADKSQLLREYINSIVQRDDFTLAISTGTPSPFRKITGIVMSSDGVALACVKIGEISLAINRIKNEANMLKHIALSSSFIAHSSQQPSIMSHERSPTSIRVPELLYEGEIGNGYILIQSPAPFEGKSGGKYFKKDYQNILETLQNSNPVKKKFNESGFYGKLKRGMDSYSLSYRDILRNGFEYLEKTINDQEITFALSHGDFAPWNMVWSRDKREVFIYDWESANPEVPAGIDLVHFLFQTGFLLRKLRGDKLLRYIQQTLTDQKLSTSLPLPSPDVLVLLYSLNMAITEDEPQQLSSAAVERRNIIKLIARRS